MHTPSLRAFGMVQNNNVQDVDVMVVKISWPPNRPCYLILIYLYLHSVVKIYENKFTRNRDMTWFHVYPIAKTPVRHQVGQKWSLSWQAILPASSHFWNFHHYQFWNIALILWISLLYIIIVFKHGKPYCQHRLTSEMIIFINSETLL